MTAMLYACKIVNEEINNKTKQPWEFKDVPAKLKAQTAEVLINDFGMPELVPVEFGGTLED